MSVTRVAVGGASTLAAVQVRGVEPSEALGRSRYDALFEACPDALVQQSSWWADVVGPLGPDEVTLLLASLGDLDVGGLPLYRYRSPEGCIVTSVPQAGPMGGVFTRPGLAAEARDDVYRVLLQHAVALAATHEALTLTLITNPFTPDGELYDRFLQPDLVLENFTQWIDLEEAVSGGRIALRDYQRRTNLSRNVRKAHEQGFTVGLGETREDFEAWYAVHAARHRELGAAPLREELLRGLWANLGARGKAFLVLVKDRGRIVSGCLNVHHRTVVDAYMLSMDSRYAESGANFLTTEQCLLESARRGARIYNWQSSPSRKSGVYSYKAQWGSCERGYRFVTRRLAPADVLLRIGIDRLRAAYAGHYVVPFAALQDEFSRRVHEK